MVAIIQMFIYTSSSTYIIECLFIYKSKVCTYIYIRLLPYIKVIHMYEMSEFIKI